MAPDSIGEFEILGNLGNGAHSSILHIRRSADGAQYALKVVNIENEREQKYLVQAQDEFHVSQLLNHPNLIKIHSLESDVDQLSHTGKLRLLIEYINGKTIDLVPGLSLCQLVQIFAKVAAGLGHMHELGVFHGDIKPTNILLSRSGDVKIIDFGLAWIKGQRKERLRGTRHYMAPEQASTGIINERTEIYSLGATMYRLVTFRLPPATMDNSGKRSLDAQTYANTLKPVEKCNFLTPPVLCELIHKCLSYDAQQRPERMSDVLAALEHLAGSMVRRPMDSLEGMKW